MKLFAVLLGFLAFHSSCISAQGIASLLGTLLAPVLPVNFLTDNPLPFGFPWGLATILTSPYTNPPTNNVKRSYDLTIARSTLNINGVDRPVVLINDQFPGPTLEANWGDTFEITVHNNITGPEEPTTLHWHGMLQKNTQYEDGIPGVSQCPLAPGQKRVYSFKADLFGTGWYHSHFSAQYAAGLFGPMVIYGPKQSGVSYDKDLGPVILSDWSYTEYSELVALAVGKDQTGVVDSDISLINGKSDATFNFTSGQSYRLRLINTAAEAAYVFSIDEHQFSVISHDYVPVKPYTTKNVTLSVGERVDIVVNATGDRQKSYYMRSWAQNCTTVRDGTATATIYYDRADRNASPSSTPVGSNAALTACDLPPFGITEPVLSISPPGSPAVTINMTLVAKANESGNPQWYVNDSPFHANYNEPPLLLAHAGNTSYNPAAHWNVYNFGSNSSVRLIVHNTNTFTSHPMHMHGHNFWVMAQGFGTWDGKVQAGSNPMRRDTHVLSKAQSADVPSYLVLEYNQDNPGVWPFHCHIAWHVSGGLYANLLERPRDLPSVYFPQKSQDTCNQYEAWQAKGNIVDEIDSGE